MASFTVTKGVTLPDSSAKSDFHNMVDLATITMSNVVNADISASAAIASTKLNLATISEVVAMSSKTFKQAQGANVASATTTTLGEDGNMFKITGTTTITSVTIKAAGTVVVLWFAGILTFTDGSNLVLQGNFTTAADDTITLVSDGTNWIEVCRSRITTIAPVTLSDTSTIATDASQSSHFRVTLAGNRTLGNPTSARDGQKILWEIIQDATGGRSLALDTKFTVPDDIGTITLTATANKRALLAVTYNSTADKFYVAAFLQEF